MFRKIYYVHPKVLCSYIVAVFQLLHSYVRMCKMCFCAICAYVRSKVSCDDHTGYRRRRVSKFTKSITACLGMFFVFLAVKGCSGVFGGVYRGLGFGAFGKLSLFCGVLRLQIYDSVWSGLPTLFFDVADGGFFYG